MVEHNAHEKNPGHMSKKKKKITLKLSFFVSPAVGKTAIEIVHNFTQKFFVERAEIGII